MLILLEIPHKNGIILSQMGVQARLAMHYKQGNKFYKDDYIIFFFFMGLLYGTHLGNLHMG